MLAPSPIPCNLGWIVRLDDAIRSRTIRVRELDELEGRGTWAEWDWGNSILQPHSARALALS